MAEDLLTQQFDRFNLSTRARKVVLNDFGSFEAVSEAIRHKEVRDRNAKTLADRPDLEPTYTLTGWRWGIEFKRRGIGSKTAIEIAVATLLLGLVTFEECNFGDSTELSLRQYVNLLLDQHGWEGPRLPGRKRGGKTLEEIEQAKRNKLIQRRETLLEQVSAIDEQLNGTPAPSPPHP